MSQGVLMFGFNNETMDYLKICVINAKLIKANMGNVDISIVTSEYSLGWDWTKNNINEINAIANLIVLPGMGGLNDTMRSRNKRVYRDTQYYSKSDVFLNHARSDAFALSPYDETLLIDCDYLILSNSLNSVWGSIEDFLITDNATTLNHENVDAAEFRLNPYGIRMYWATVIYFRKTERAKLVFDLVDHIKNNWRFYSLVYDFPASLFRNDFAFSIAIHMLSGFQENTDFKPVPDSILLTSPDKDQIIKFTSANELLTYVKTSKDEWSFTLQKIKNLNVHIMNKLALLNLADEILEVINE